MQLLLHRHYYNRFSDKNKRIGHKNLIMDPITSCWKIVLRRKVAGDSNLLQRFFEKSNRNINLQQLYEERRAISSNDTIGMQMRICK